MPLALSNTGTLTLILTDTEHTNITLFQTKEFSLFQIESICRRQFQRALNGANYFDRVANIVGKGENAGDSFPVFSKRFPSGSLQSLIA